MSLLKTFIWLVLLVVLGRQLLIWQKDERPPEPPLAQKAIVEPSIDPSANLASTQIPPKQTPTSASKQPIPKVNQDKFIPWPQFQLLTVPRDMQILITESNREKKLWSYQSDNFLFSSDAQLRDHVIREFAAIFELTHRYCQRIPFPLPRLEKGSDKPLRIHLIERYPHFLARGGTPGSGGVYLSDQDCILVPFQALGLKNGVDGYSLDLQRSNRTLVHETTHMLMKGPLLQAGWFIEGSAEYLATIPMKRNRLMPSQHFEAIVSYLTAFGRNDDGGYNLGKSILLPSIEELMESDYETFRALPNSYPASLLLFTYFAHLDQDGNAAGLCRYAEALASGEPKGTARKHLLADRGYQTLKKLLTNSWAKYDIQLHFNN